MRGRGAVAAVVALAVLAGVVVWQWERLPWAGPPSPDGAAAAFAAAWADDRLDAAPWDGPPADHAAAASDFTAWSAGMEPTGRDHPTGVEVTDVQTDGDVAEAALEVRWDLGDGETWSYTSPLALRLVDDRWGVVPQPVTVHPQLATGQQLRATEVPAPRAGVLGGDGSALVAERPVVVVGIEPRRTTDLAATVARTVEILAGVDVQVDAAGLLARAQAAAPDAFVEVVTLREGVYLEVRSLLQPLPGTVFRDELRQLAPTSDFARALLGSVGPATAEVIERSGGQVRAGDVVGLSGLQAELDEQLAGRPGLRIDAVPASDVPVEPADGEAEAGDAADPDPDAASVILHQVGPTPGDPVWLTLDERTQLAADAAVREAATPAALVALRATTGEVLAVANGGGDDGGGYDRALLGRYPPGSTFKVASALALLRTGLTPDDTVDCPATTVVDGRSFRNAEDHVLGPVPFAVDFAQSCNTAFIDAGRPLDGEALRQAAVDLGYRPHDLGVASADATVPVADDPVEHAATVIGQGEVLASPLAVAVSAASVAAGHPVSPHLLAERAAPAGAPLDPGPVQALQAMMRQTVTEGTGRALAGAPGGPVAGKTGTAEYGGEVPPRTHAWFAGHQGDLAFAVLVEDGGFGADAAVPVAAAFLTALHGG